jgi:hypothetical protein
MLICIVYLFGVHCISMGYNTYIQHVLIKSRELAFPFSYYIFVFGDFELFSSMYIMFMIGYWEP